MGVIGTVIDTTRGTRGGQTVDDVRVQLGGGEIITAPRFSDPGDDSVARAGDLVFLNPSKGAGRYVVAGFIDKANAQTAEPGERLVYSRDASGTPVAWCHFRADGSVSIVAPGGVDINGFTVGAAGEAESPVSLTSPSAVINGKELAEHDHAINSGSSAPGPTGPNL